jgi:hypothetical protein
LASLAAPESISFSWFVTILFLASLPEASESLVFYDGFAPQAVSVKTAVEAVPRASDRLEESLASAFLDLA